MENYAEASCILKVNIHCQACKMRIVEVLGSICGEYNIDINIEEGLVRVFALVDPNLLMKALSRTGYHAELKWARLQHPKVSRNYQSYGGYNHGGAVDYYPGQGYYSHNNMNYSHAYTRALPDPYSSYPSHNYYPTHPYYYQGPDPYHSDQYNHGLSVSPARWSSACRRPRPFGGF